MCTRILSEAFPVTDKSVIKSLGEIQEKLDRIPDTFSALFWLYNHDFLYMSPGIEKVLGFPYENFEKHGIVFFTSIIPPELIDPIFKSMYRQAEEIVNHPNYLLSPSLLEIDAAVLNSKMQPVPVSYYAVLLDSKIYEPPSYLVFSCWLNTSGKTGNQILYTGNYIRTLLLELKNFYFSGNPELHEMLLSRKNITEREKEVVHLLSRGYNTKDIACQLNISFNTVETHRKHLLEKLQAKNTAELMYKVSSILNLGHQDL